MRKIHETPQGAKKTQINAGQLPSTFTSSSYTSNVCQNLLVSKQNPG